MAFQRGLHFIKKYPLSTSALIYSVVKENIGYQKTKQYIKKYDVSAIATDKIDAVDAKVTTNSKAINTHLVIAQAFKDIGFRGNIYLNIIPRGLNSMGIAPAGLNAALVQISETTFTQEDYAALYTMAAHEAIHFEHRHEFLFNFMNVYAFKAAPVFYKFPQQLVNHLTENPIKNKLLFRFLLRLCSFPSAIFGLALAGSFVEALPKLSEIDADITSAMKVGCASEAINFFRRNPTKPVNSDTEFFSRPPKIHPHSETRIKYLNFVRKLPGVPTVSLLYHSPFYNKILERDGRIKSHLSTPK